MKRKILLTALALLSVITCVFCLVACGDGDNTPPKQEPFTVTFETNGGSAIEPIYCTEAKSLENILGDKTTVKEGKKFVGWFKDEALQNEADLEVVIKVDKTFYAKWRDLTDDEVLENAILNAFDNAVAVKDTGYVRTGTSNSDVSTSINAVWTLENGVLTSGSNSTRYFKDGAVYGVLRDEKTKLVLDDADEAAAYLYHNSVFRSLGFYSVFSPLAMAFAATDSACTLEKTDDGFQVKYIGQDIAVRLTYVKYGMPYIYFDGGKTFDYKIEDGKLVEAKQSGSKTRTLTFYYEGDELPEVSEPEDISEYEQKWQLKVDVVGNGTKILYESELDKAYLDKECVGDDYKPQTVNLTYYYDEEMTQAINFTDGKAVLDKHTTIYHPGVDKNNLTVAKYAFTSSTGYYNLGDTTSPEGIVTTKLMMKEEMNGVNSLRFSLIPQPLHTTNPTPIVTFESTPDTADASVFENKITVTPSSGGTYYDIEVVFPISGQYTLKIASDDGFVCQYVKVLPKP
ncbi:MAG: InlB B-repeat-containing protein [Bacteroides sp.]|nr:InlB B-repeat-containing protein [Bacillota bacterium]MCM1394151.1 InlB B-repeat-containing protein [[Eubacterium] siraeum]MCM1455633.1 InlB B-repeat-containing protein [Bacteroides sp.]